MEKFAPTAHTAQLLDMTTELVAAVLKLKKVEIVDDDRLDFGNFLEFESIQTFDGAPVRYLVELFNITDPDGDTVVKRAVLYLRAEVVEMGGMVANTYLTPLKVFDSVSPETFLQGMAQQFNVELGGSHAQTADGGYWFNWLGRRITAEGDEARLVELVDKAVSDRNTRRKKIRELMEAASRGAADAALRLLRSRKEQNVECALVENEYTALAKTAKRFVRPGKPDYAQSRVQMLNFIIDKNDLGEHEALAEVVKRLARVNTKIERAITKTYPPVTRADVCKIPKDYTKQQLSDLKRDQIAKRQHRQKQQEVIKNKVSPQARIGMNGDVDFDDLLNRVLVRRKPSKDFIVRNGRIVYKPEQSTARRKSTKTYPKKAGEVMRQYKSDEEIEMASELETLDETAVTATIENEQIKQEQERQTEQQQIENQQEIERQREIERVLAELLVQQQQKPLGNTAAGKTTVLKTAPFIQK